MNKSADYHHDNGTKSNLGSRIKHGQSSCSVRQPHVELGVEPSRPEDSGVEDGWQVSGRHQVYTRAGQEATHLRQEGVHDGRFAAGLRRGQGVR